MQTLLQTLRSALTYEIALAGARVPLDDAGVPSPASFSPAEPGPVAGSAPPHAPGADMPTTDLFGNEIDPSEDTSRPPHERLEALLPEDSPLRGMTTLDEVERYARETVLVPIDARRTNAVFGTGNPEADLVVIGEAPGADEDRTGEPFVGRAGQLLNKILAAIGFDREDVYIANILKSRPPNNRDPLPEEVEAHLPMLLKQLALIRPRLILCVGKTAGNTLLRRQSSLAALRGRFHDFYGIPVMVTYHPAALLRNPQWKRPTWEDVQLLRARYDELVGS
ncbi:MAG: uracil-DNA glycosylase [Bacteroidetes bacterium]|nr:uracil-DNA glycosylase [Rhodothermaceae bacterium RA]RMH65149.1 MAG: uracil-DNA glycosylase [Bacteroidota bacterium]